MDNLESIQQSHIEAAELQKVLTKRLPDFEWTCWGMTAGRQAVAMQPWTEDRVAAYMEYSGEESIPSPEEIFEGELNTIGVQAITKQKWEGRGVVMEVFIGRELLEDDYLAAITLLKRMVKLEVDRMVEEKYG